jgi:hypothetical protein
MGAFLLHETGFGRFAKSRSFGKRGYRREPVISMRRA